jgi:hypothetical protein
MRVDYSTGIAKGYTVLLRRVDYSSIIAKRVFYSTDKGRLFYNFSKKGFIIILIRAD